MQIFFDLPVQRVHRDDVTNGLDDFLCQRLHFLRLLERLVLNILDFDHKQRLEVVVAFDNHRLLRLFGFPFSVWLGGRCLIHLLI